MTELRIGVPNGCTAAIDTLPGHGMHWRNWKTPSYIQAGFQMHALVEMHYEATRERCVDDAVSRNPQAWRRKVEFNTENLAAEANPNGSLLLVPKLKILPTSQAFTSSTTRCTLATIPSARRGYSPGISLG